MKLQVVTAAAALLVASVAALPAPVPIDNNHGLLPDTDDWVDDDGVVEVRDTEAVVADVLKAREVIAARDVDADDDDVDDDVIVTIEVVEARDNHATEVDETGNDVGEGIAARDADDDDDGIVVTIEDGLETPDEHVPEADDVDDLDEAHISETITARDVEGGEDNIDVTIEKGFGSHDEHASEVEEVDELDETHASETITARDVDDEGDDIDVTIEEGLEARDDLASEVDEVEEGDEVDVDVTEAIVSRDVEDEDVTATIEVLETRDADMADDADADNNTEDAPSAVEARKVQIDDAAANFNFTSDFGFALDRLLAEIESIPDDVLAAGDEALHKWLVEHGERAGDDNSATLKRDEDSSDDAAVLLLERGELLARASWWKVTKCVAAIVQLLATTAVPAAKLLRIKKYIEALGGVKQAVQLLLGATTKAEKLRAGGEALVALSAELLGISTVKNNCF